ncbi:kelch domain-containing protein 7B [Sciurus carolinensis]|uniref:kelch domain-containing protein 7B n=1 Tax=Sciurus carolinensis TaxID=30640 RepID=UPI001FB1B5A1|nr:kelch domain-containing protein 7B [Sciurus carolinensis]
MIQGALEAGGPLWGWDGDGDDDGDSAVLALLAVAVVAATALALHWFGSGQDQEVAGPKYTAPEIQSTQEARLALHPEYKVSGGSEGDRRRQGKSHPPRLSQESPATSTAQDREPLVGRVLAATAELPLRTLGDATSRGALGQQHGNTTPGALRGKGREPPRSDTVLLGRSKAAGTPAPLLIHFTLRSPGGEAELQAGAGGASANGPACQVPIHTQQQDSSRWHLPGSLGTVRRSRRPGTQAVLGDRTCRPSKPDPLRLGAAVSVWNAVDAVDSASAAAMDAHARSPGAGSGLSASAQGPSPQTLPQTRATETGPGTNGSERGREKSSPPPAPVHALGSGAQAGESGETRAPAPREALGGRAPAEGWSWARRAVVGTRGFGLALDSAGGSLGGPPWGLSPAGVQAESCGARLDRAAGPADGGPSLDSGVGGAERPGDRRTGGGRESQPSRGREQAAGGPAAELESPRTLHRGRPTADGHSRAPSTSRPATNPPRGRGPGRPSPEAAGSAAPGPSPSNSLPHGVSREPSEGENGSAAPASSTAPVQVSTPAPTGILAPSPLTAPSPATLPASALSPTLVPPTASASASAPASTLSPSPTSPPAPASVSGSRPASGESKVGLSRSYQEGQISTSWGNLITMVLRSHPFPRQEEPRGSAPRAVPVSPAGPSSSIHSADRPSASHSEGAIPHLQGRHTSSLGIVTQSEGLAKVLCQAQSMSFETNGAPTHDPPLGPKGDGTEEKSLDSLPSAAVPGGPSQPCVHMQPGPAPSSAMKWDPQHVPRPRKHSMCEIARSSERLVSQVVPEQHQGEVLREGASPAGSREVLTEKQKEAQKLMVFLQRPGRWRMVEGPQKPHSLPLEPAAAVPRPLRLDLGSCLEVLAFAQQRGEPGLAQETYTLMSNNLLHVLGDPNLYRQLSGADREHILSLRTGQGQAVLGVLVLPRLYQVCHSGLKKSSYGEEVPAAQPAPLPHPPYLHVFNPQENIWRPLTQVPEEAPLRGCGLCTMHNYLFLAGGIRGSGAKAVCSKEVFCYNPLTNIWSQVRPMQQARAQLKLVALDGLLYAIGGECLYSMERYDPRTDAWTLRAPLPAGTFPVAHEAVACRGDIYVTGGHLFYRLLRYSPVKDSWDECPYSASHRRSSDMVALGGFLYRFDLLRGVGAAVMRYNTVTGSWSRAASLPLPDAVPLRCTVLGNTIYCLNHQVTATFVVSEGTAQFQAKELQPFPLGNKGILCPFILTLPPEAQLQTSL